MYIKKNIKTAIIFIALVAVWLSWPFLNPIWASFVPDPPLNEFGDSFGSISALFSGLAIVGLVVSLIRQRDDFDQSMEELVKQNKLMADSMSLELIPTVFNQKLRDLKDTNVLQNILHEKNIENFNIDTITEKRINRWQYSLEKYRQKQLLQFICYYNDSKHGDGSLSKVLECIRDEFKSTAGESLSDAESSEFESILEEMNAEISKSHLNDAHAKFEVTFPSGYPSFFEDYPYSKEAIYVAHDLRFLSESQMLDELSNLSKQWEVFKVDLLKNLLGK